MVSSSNTRLSTAHSGAAVRVSRGQVAALRLVRQHLDTRAPAGTLLSIVGDMGGAQAQVLSAAQISLWARIGQLHAPDVEAAIRQRRLVIEGMIHAALEAMHEPLTRREIAERRLLRRYLQTFGSATPADFAYWVDIPLREARAIWVREEARLAPVRVEGT